MPKPRPSQASFDDVLDALLDRENPFPPTYLHRFSDLPPAEVIEFKKVFPRVEVARRRALLEDLEQLADADPLVLVENLGYLALEDEDAQVRAAGIRLLWDVEDKTLAPILIQIMRQDPDVQVRATAATALGIFVYLGEVEEIPEDVSTEVEESLLEVANSKEDALVRRRVIESLGFSGRSEVLDLIKAAYKQKDTEWIESALFAMGRSADQAWQDDILAMFEHTKATVQSEAIQAAGELQLDAAREPLLTILENNEDDEDVRTAAIWSLAQIGGEGVRPALEGLIETSEDDDEVSFIEEALEILDFTEEMSGFDLLEIGVDDEDQYIIEPEPDSSDGKGSQSETSKDSTKNPKRHKRK
jgi:HEAT repeat protein